MEQRVGTLSTVKQPTVVAHPFRTSQCRRLHIVGSLNDGDTQPRELGDCGIALVRADDDGIGMQGDDLLYIRRHRVSAVHDFARFYPTLYVGDDDILQVAYADDAVLQMKVFQQLTVRCREHDHTTKRTQGTMGFLLAASLEQQPLLQDLTLLPRVHHGDGSPVALIVHL